MKRLFIVIIIIYAVTSCQKKDNEPVQKENPKIILSGSYDKCQSLYFNITRENGNPTYSSRYNAYSYNSSTGVLEKITITETVTYYDNGHVYHVEAIVWVGTCSYTITVTDQNNVSATCHS